MLGTTVFTSTIIVPFMGGVNVSNTQIDEAGPSTAQPLHRRTDEAGLSDAQPLHMQINEAGPSNSQPLYSSDDLPKTVVANLNEGSAVKSMDFHSIQQTFLLVGTITGDVSVWEVGCVRMLASRNFKVWDMGSCSLKLQASLANEYSASVTCVRWSPRETDLAKERKCCTSFWGLSFKRLLIGYNPRIFIHNKDLKLVPKSINMTRSVLEPAANLCGRKSIKFIKILS